MATDQGKESSWKQPAQPKTSTQPKKESDPFGDELLRELQKKDTQDLITSEPQRGLETEVKDIFKQAEKHRNVLIIFYIIYTVALSFVVISLIFLQAQARLVPGSETIELVPQPALYLLVVGMFGQFIGLLTIVTRKVWTYESFFEYQKKNGSRDSSPDEKW